MNDGSPDLHRLQIRKLTVLAGDGGSRAELSVFCPVREESMGSEACRRCVRRRAIHEDASGGFVVCATGIAPAKRTSDVAEATARVPLGALLQSDMTAVREDVSVATVTGLLLRRGVGCVPVVRRDGGVVGIVTRADLLQRIARHAPAVGSSAPGSAAALHGAAMPASVAGDVMTRAAHCMPEDARLAHAFALMVEGNVAHVLIVSTEGALVGVVSAGDANQWVARELGVPVPMALQRPSRR